MIRWEACVGVDNCGICSLFSPYLGSGNPIQVTGLHNKHLNMLSHPTSCKSVFFFNVVSISTTLLLYFMCMSFASMHIWPPDVWNACPHPWVRSYRWLSGTGNWSQVLWKSSLCSFLIFFIYFMFTFVTLLLLTWAGLLLVLAEHQNLVQTKEALHHQATPSLESCKCFPLLRL